MERSIKRRWSPEQISHCMKLGRVKVNGDSPKIIIAVQTIYDWIYRFHKELKNSYVILEATGIIANIISTRRNVKKDS